MKKQFIILAAIVFSFVACEDAAEPDYVQEQETETVEDLKADLDEIITLLEEQLENVTETQENLLKQGADLLPEQTVKEKEQKALLIGESSEETGFETDADSLPIVTEEI